MMLLFALMCFGLILAITGCIFLTRKKFIYSSYYSILFIVGLSFAPHIVQPMPGEDIKLYLSAFLLFILVTFYIEMGRYTIVNVDDEMIKMAIISALEKEEIGYHIVNDHTIALEEYQKTIHYRCFLNSGDISFRKIRKLSVAGKIKKELFRAIKCTEAKVFPSSGVFLIIAGLFLLSWCLLLI